jgi:pseudouridine synthase
MKERLQKVLASAGVASRRGAEELIASGTVTVNGSVARIGMSVDPERDVIAVSGVRLERPSSLLYVALHKPPGYVSSLRSTHGERTVMELLPEVSERIYPVGRLDQETSGLLLLTNDGDWANIATHPRFGVEKQYLARVQGQLSERAMERLRDCVFLPDGSRTSPAKVEVLGRHPRWTRVSVTVVEGKKRQIRLMAVAVGHPVLELRRVRVGPIRLADLPEGRWRPLSEEEIEGLRAYGGHGFVGAGETAQPAGRDRRAGRSGEVDDRARHR